MNALHDKGERVLEHGRSNKYYKDLCSHTEAADAMQDDVAGGHIASQKPPRKKPRKFRPRLVRAPAAEPADLPSDSSSGSALTERSSSSSSSRSSSSSSSGGPGDGGAEAGADAEGPAVAEAPADPAASSEREIDWGPFKVLCVARPGYKGFQMACPYHRDEGDAKGTRCTRTVQYGRAGADDEDMVLRRLKQWCLDGRFQISRRLADDEGGHKGTPFCAEPPTNADLDAQLEAAMSEPNWILIA